MEFMSPFGMFSPLGPMLSAPLLPSTRSVGYVPGVRLGANVNDLGWVRDLRRIAAGGGRGVCLLVSCGCGCGRRWGKELLTELQR